MIEKKIQETEIEVANEVIEKNPKYAKIKKNVDVNNKDYNDKIDSNRNFPDIKNYAREMLNVKKIYDAENNIKKIQIKKMIKRMKNIILNLH